MSSRAVDPSISRTPLPTDAKDVATVCVLCSHNCGLRVDVADGRIVDGARRRVEPDHARLHLQQGLLDRPLRRARAARPSIRSSAAPTAASSASPGSRRSARSPPRLTRDPRRRTRRAPSASSASAARPTTWTRRTASASSPPSARKRWFNAFAQEKTQHFLIDQWMFDAPPSTFFHPDIEHSALPPHARHQPEDLQPRPQRHRHVQGARRRIPQQTLVVLDPRETETTRTADRHLRIKPGSDAYVLLGMAAAIVASEGLVDARLVEQQTVGFEALRQALGAGRHRRDGAPRRHRRPPTCSTSRAATPRPSRRRSCSTSPSSTICSRPSPRT